jgi:hypothetical protein
VFDGEERVRWIDDAKEGRKSFFNEVWKRLVVVAR